MFTFLNFYDANVLIILKHQNESIPEKENEKRKTGTN